jgi:hypothetical protein
LRLINLTLRCRRRRNSRFLSIGIRMSFRSKEVKGGWHGWGVINEPQAVQRPRVQ